ncbi:TonB-dependent receptor [Parabacteroides sp. ZJ-118]|uniref:SusC/RagA family TonB-linked outer membrane protein n=1 Tax=Parabacteroides sp. ZJ-118 TaxID=2709398 RepID=UPI0013EBA421|nr:TonB-dependent receptor [Parabacteroides sp. ZJ-118]
MMNKKLASVKGRLGLALCFLMIGAGVTPTIHASNAQVSITQQAKKVTGTVTDAKGEPLLGVNVVVKGTTNGTITDLDGKYSLEVEPNSILVVSYIGYVSQQIPASGSVVNVTLKEDTQNLDEVVVVGYGTQQKKDITGSVAVVDTKELLASSGSSAAQQLQGKAAGVYVGQSGSPGSATMVRIRGINSVNDNGPLYVIDGVSTRNQNMSSLNPNDIESMQVLKDASAAAIYGAQAANGVILITTKKGTKSGQPKVTYDGYIGMQKTTKKYDVLNSADRLALEWESQQNSYTIRGVDEVPEHPQFGKGPKPTIPNYLTTNGAQGSQNISMDDYSFPDNQIVPFSDTDWWDAIDRTALMQNHQVGLSGGTEKGTYNVSANYFKQDGTVIDSYYQRYQVRANTTFNIRPWLRAGENMTYAFSKDNGLQASAAESSAYSWTYRASPWVPVRDERGNYAGSKITGTGNFENPVARQERNRDNYWTNSRVFGNLWAEADLYKGLTFRTNFGLDYTNNYSYRMSKKNLEFSESPGTNNLEEASGFNFRWVWTNTLTYNAVFNDVHKLNVLLGTEAIRDGIGRSMTGQRFGYLMEDNTNTWVLNMGENDARRRAESAYNGEFALFGMFARVDYSFADKYLVTGIVRRDGVSRFSEANRYGVFPSVSLGWRISQESFMKDTKDWLDDLKLRVGYGQTGNSEMSRKTNYAFEYATNPTITNYDLGASNSGSMVGFRLSKYGNEDTKWEATEMTNVGLDASFLNGKFGLGFEWYYKKTSDMLIEAAYSGLASSEIGKPYLNYGDMKNTGWDLTFNYRDSKGDWGWDIGLNASAYKNEVLKLSDTDDFFIGKAGARFEGEHVTRTTKGQPISSFFGYNIIGFYESAEDVKNSPLPYGISSKEELKPEQMVGKFKFEDRNNDGKVNGEDRTFIGSPHPDLILSLNASLTWKNWDFTMFWYSTIGNDIFNNTKYFTDFPLFGGNRSTRMRDLSWRPGADNSKAILPILDSKDSWSGAVPSSYYVEDGSFLRLKNVVLGYTFPKALLQKATISNLRVYIQAENLLTISGYSGLDPEFTNADVGEGNGADLRRGIDMGGWPTTLRLLFGVNFAF